MSLRDDLIAARALIQDPACWLKGELADRDNTCFCAYGAAEYGPSRSWDGAADTEAARALVDALPEPFRTGTARKHRLAEFNDDPATTHADILALFDRAIEAAR